MSRMRYTPQQKAAIAYRVIVGGESITAVASDSGATRKTISGWVKSAAVQHLVREMRSAKTAKAPPRAPQVEPGGDILPELTRHRLRDAILRPMPMQEALAYCRLSADALDRWGELADGGDDGARLLLLDLRQWAAEAVFTLTRIVLEGASPGKGAQFLLSKLWRDSYGESVDEAPARNAVEAYSDADLDAIIAQEGS